jgi:hypothetical protein
MAGAGIRRGRKEKRDEVQVTAFIPLSLKKNLWKLLIDEGLTYREWLTGRIREYIVGKERHE